jgi:hypothetical protein
MKNGNGLIPGTGAAAATLPVAGPDQLWLAALAFVLVVGGFALGRWAAARGRA